ncbi:MAG: T9SS type A sorting domain-containing protein, partial [Saprospiraceae bacterium]|nr:T9SS type A sorting domain-containing protein [Saprospiraceae bacterium]
KDYLFTYLYCQKLKTPKYYSNMKIFLRIPIHIKLLFTIFLMVGVSSLQAQTCDADFFGTNQGNYSIQFQNISAGTYDNVVWDFGDGTNSTVISSSTHTYASAGTYQVCLIVSETLTSCQSIICHNVTIDGTGEYLDSTCYYTDCVFPGDANYDNIVNVYDVLSIALYNNSAEIARPNATTNFVGQAAANWQTTTADNVNLKHVDADGNGTINLNDLAVVQQNFTFEHDGVEQKAEGTPLWLQFDAITYPTSPNAPFIVSAGIMLGSSNTPANDLLGLAFLLDYDSSLVVPGSVNIVYHNASIIGQNNTAATLAIDNTVGSVAMANARTDQTFVTGYSRIATAYFTITDIVIGRQSQVKFNLFPHDIQAIDTLGYPIAMEGFPNSITFSTTSTESVLNNYRNISIYPNPVEDVMTLELGDTYADYIEIYDNLGNKVKEQSINQRGTLQIAVESLPTGFYVIKIQTEENAAVKRIFIR